MPKNKKDIPRKKGKFGNLPLPIELIKELHDWKASYILAWSDPAPDGEQYRMTMEQLIRRLLEGVKRLDPEVWAIHQAANKSREEHKKMMADFMAEYLSDLYDTKKELDVLFDGPTPPTSMKEMKEKEDVTINSDDNSTEEDVWDIKYFFTNDEGAKIEALVGDKAPFYCKMNGQSIGMTAMLKKGWKLINEAGIEIKNISNAWQINHLIKQHNPDND